MRHSQAKDDVEHCRLKRSLRSECILPATDWQGADSIRSSWDGVTRGEPGFSGLFSHRAYHSNVKGGDKFRRPPVAKLASPGFQGWEACSVRCSSSRGESVLTRVAHPFLCPLKNNILYSVQPQESRYRPPGVSVLGVDGTGHLSWAFFFVSFISARSSAASHAAAMPCIIPHPRSPGQDVPSDEQDTLPYSSTTCMV